MTAVKLTSGYMSESVLFTCPKHPQSTKHRGVDVWNPQKPNLRRFLDCRKPFFSLTYTNLGNTNRFIHSAILSLQPGYNTPQLKKKSPPRIVDFSRRISRDPPIEGVEPAAGPKKGSGMVLNPY